MKNILASIRGFFRRLFRIRPRKPDIIVTIKEDTATVTGLEGYTATVANGVVSFNTPPPKGTYIAIIYEINEPLPTSQKWKPISQL